MTVQRVSPIGDLQAMTIAEPTPVAAGKFVGTTGATPASAPSAAAVPAAPAKTPVAAPAADAPDYDDIPF